MNEVSEGVQVGQQIKIVDARGVEMTAIINEIGSSGKMLDQERNICGQWIKLTVLIDNSFKQSET